MADARLADVLASRAAALRFWKGPFFLNEKLCESRSVARFDVAVNLSRHVRIVKPMVPLEGKVREGIEAITDGSFKTEGSRFSTRIWNLAKTAESI